MEPFAPLLAVRPSLILECCHCEKGTPGHRFRSQTGAPSVNILLGK